MKKQPNDMLLVRPDTHHHDHAADDFTHLGMAADVTMLNQTPISRRRILAMGAVGVGVLLASCAPAQPSGNTNGGGNTGNENCKTLPSETAGPYPADGSRALGQTLNILDDTGIVRSDIRQSLATQNTVDGVALDLTMTLLDTNNDCNALAGYVIYAWHCTPDGNYSLYNQGFTNEDYLRGAQVTDANGKVTFKTVFPGCYAGRWPHVHFEIYENLAAAVQGNVGDNVKLVSQFAFPKAPCATVYADSRYGNSSRNLGQLSLDSDNVFRDGYDTQMAAVTGSVSAGYTADIIIGI